MPPFNRARFTPTRAAAQPAAGDVELWELVDQARAGDARAFGDFFDATVSTVYAYVYRRVTGDRETAEEITSDVYLAAWRAIDRVRRVSASPAAWLVTIAQRRVIDHYRSRARRNDFPAGSTLDVEAYRRGPGYAVRPAENVCIDRDEARALWRYAEQLTDDQHRVLRCRFWLGLSVDDTAAVMGKPRGAVKALQYRALQNLRAQLAGTELDPSDGAAFAAA